jgi:hypothetical protein
MSNHAGSYFLNAILMLLEEYSYFKNLGSAKTLEFINEAIKLCPDCNNGEILDEIGERLGICYMCVEYAKELEDGICPSCEQCLNE